MSGNEAIRGEEPTGKPVGIAATLNILCGWAGGSALMDGVWTCALAKGLRGKPVSP